MASCWPTTCTVLSRTCSAIWASVLPLLKSGATVHYIVGQTRFSTVTCARRGLLAQQMAAVGLCDVRCIPLRKRNSKKGLVDSMYGRKA